MKTIFGGALALCLTSCATGPSLVTYNGGHYLIGDKPCKTAQPSAYLGQVTCYDGKGNATGNRPALTEAEMQIYAAYLRSQAASVAQTTAALQATNQALMQQNQQIMNSTQGYKPPEVQPVTPSSGTAIVYCRDLSGNVIACKQIK